MVRVWRDVPWHDPLLVAAHLRRLCGHYLPTQWRAYLRRLRVKSTNPLRHLSCHALIRYAESAQPGSATRTGTNLPCEALQTG